MPLRRFILGLLVAAWAATPAAAEKTDHILVSNGDEIVCEVEYLERGILFVSSDYMRSVRLDWAQLSRVESELEFEVETRDGQLYFGQLAPSDEDRVLVVSGDLGSFRLPFAEVVQLHQTESSRRGHLEGGILFGFSFAQASDVTKLSFNGNVARRTQKFLGRFDLVAILTDVEGKTLSREEASYTFTRHLMPRWNYDLAASYQANEELGLDRRWLVRGGPRSPSTMTPSISTIRSSSCE